MGTRKDAYLHYMESDEWKKVRAAKLMEGRGQCATCTRTTQLHVHHRTYERLGSEYLSDLVVLCRVCHETLHKHLRLGEYGFVPKKTGKPKPTDKPRLKKKGRKNLHNRRWALIDALEKVKSPGYSELTMIKHLKKTNIRSRKVMGELECELRNRGVIE